MKPIERVVAAIALAVLLSSSAVSAQTAPPVTPPPDSFFEMVHEGDREVAQAFYKKYIDVKGMPVVSADVVADAALQRTYEIATRMLAGRPDVVAALVKNKMYLIVVPVVVGLALILLAKPVKKWMAGIQ